MVADQAETVYKIKKNWLKDFEVIENKSYNDGKNILANEYALETDRKEKEKILNKQIELAKEHRDMHLKGEAWLKKETLKLKSNSILFDVNQAIELKDYNGAKTLLIKNKNNIDSDEFEKKLLEINTQYVNVL